MKGNDIMQEKPLETLIDEGYLKTTPITYEDFLPVSAAGIFKSNLVEGGIIETSITENHEAELAQAVGKPLLNPFELYASQESNSIKKSISLLTQK